MIDRRQITAGILAQKNRAAQWAEKMKGHQYSSPEEFACLFTNYLCAKFMLAPEELDTDDFYRICQYSVERASQFPPGFIDAAEFASKCGGATSATNKKVLFIMALHREIGIPLEVEEVVPVNLLSQLIHLCYRKLEG